ncbi:hypothetical protein D3C71_2126160 [compost metagenome]
MQAASLAIGGVSAGSPKHQIIVFFLVINSFRGPDAAGFLGSYFHHSGLRPVHQIGRFPDDQGMASGDSCLGIAPAAPVINAEIGS